MKFRCQQYFKLCVQILTKIMWHNWVRSIPVNFSQLHCHWIPCLGGDTRLTSSIPVIWGLHFPGSSPRIMHITLPEDHVSSACLVSFLLPHLQLGTLELYHQIHAPPLCSLNFHLQVAILDSWHQLYPPINVRDITHPTSLTWQWTMCLACAVYPLPQAFSDLRLTSTTLPAEVA